MKNKLTVLGLVAATAFIFTSCTKDTDVTPGSKFAAPAATLEAPALNEGATTKNGNEYEEADNGQSIPGMETATPNPPTQNPPVLDSPSADRYEGVVKDLYPISPLPNDPHVVPYPSMDPVQSAPNASRFLFGSDLPDCTFPVISNQGPGANSN